MRHGGNVWQGGDPGRFLDFSANLRPGGPPDWVKAAMAEGLKYAAYYPDMEQRAARSVLAEYFQMDEDMVLPTAGGISAIDLAARLPAKGMYAFSPCFCEYAQQAAVHGKKMGEIPLLRGHRLLSPVEALEGREISGCTLWLCNPNNPIGAAFGPSEIEALLERVKAAEGRLVVDEAFIHYCPENSVRTLIDRHERLIITGSMTKVLGIPGLRLGYLLAGREVMETFRKQQLCWEVNCVAEAVLRALPMHAAEIHREAEENRPRREKMRAALEGMGAFVYPSQSNFLLADFGVKVAPAARRLRDKGILVRECMNFSGIDDGCHLRLNVKDRPSNQRLIQELKEAL